jgi:hypothetical protein
MRASVSLLMSLAIAGSGLAVAQQMNAAPLATPFSSAKPGARALTGWEELRLGSQKNPTQYDFVLDDGQTVLRARAEAAASGLLHPVKLDVRAAPVLQWRWKIANVIEGADNRIASKEDSPVRILLAFDGDRSKLTLGERGSSLVAKSVTGRELPYAELMYVWSNRAPVGTIIPNPHTRRVQMVVASTGTSGVGQWHSLSRNIVDDFRRAFNEEPGMLTDVGVLTDTDNTGSTVEAWYGDIRFVPAP